MLRHSAAIIALLAPAWPAMAPGIPTSSRWTAAAPCPRSTSPPVRRRPSAPSPRTRAPPGVSPWARATSSGSPPPASTPCLPWTWPRARPRSWGLRRSGHRHARHGVRGGHGHALRRLLPHNGLYNINKATGVATLIGTSTLTSFTNLGWNSGRASCTPRTRERTACTRSAWPRGRPRSSAPWRPDEPERAGLQSRHGILYLVDNNTPTRSTRSTWPRGGPRRSDPWEPATCSAWPSSTGRSPSS